MKAAKPEDSRLLRRYFQTKLAESFRQHSVEAFGILLETKRTHEIIGISAHHRLASHVLFHHCLKPEVQSIV